MSRLILFFIALVVLNGCAITKNTNIENAVGLYEIVESACEPENADSDPCKNTLFFEILKGQFMGIKDNELAYVFWSGDPKIDSELQYTSHLISNSNSKSVLGDKYFLVDDADSQEYLEFSDRGLSGYRAVYGAGDGVKRRVIHYQLIPVQRGNLPLVRLNYPGNK